ncbi:toll/interleukin-1 receptor domain-containing protein [Actinoplanes sp. Pm04-4]|uniref:Toll/interleukin-1 receptor domain-containing protein n=1 Tax=Paractinoplanes pyxinae TaxID=2997416 RepID=A0ABT4BG16_9ACTN|nr:toll/interleukin-1 receptor domain-containing protein [Actinoplanes pyxinae]MCY1145459.1 toll/interleukin-1 receptor domain-containing protein [Actinoplanes pyxinae]
MSGTVANAETASDTGQRPVVIFLSYRRGDTQWAARGIYDRLVDRYGRENVFRDLDAIPPGAKFRKYVERKISESDVFLLLIGRAWASYQDDRGRRRLEQPRDPVRLEVEAALRLGLPIIPVRVEGAPMPTESDLVPSIVDILEFNAAEVSDSRWDYDVDRLLRAITESAVRGSAPPPPVPAPAEEAETEEPVGDQAAEEAEIEEPADHQAAEENETEESAGDQEADEVESPVIELSVPEAVTESRTVRHRVVAGAAAAVTGIVILLVYLLSSRPDEPAIVAHLPGDLRATCTAEDKSATCHLADRTVVFYRLFDTAAEAEADVVNGQPMAPAGDECPPAAPGADDGSGERSSVTVAVVCRYAAGTQKGLAMFGYTAKDTSRLYVSRWVADAEPLLRGEMSTEHAYPLDWTTLTTNWARLAASP